MTTDPDTVTFISPDAPKFRVRLESGLIQFVDGRAVLSIEQADELRAGMKQKGSSLPQWIKEVSLAEAEKAVKAHQAKLIAQHSVVKGGITGMDIAHANKGHAIDFKSQLLARGVPENEIQATAQAMAGDQIAVTEAVNLEALKAANAPPNPPPVISGIPGLKLQPVSHKD